MKPLRCSIFHRYFLSVGIFQRSTLSIFLMKPLRTLLFHRYFLSVEFFRGPRSVQFTMNPLRSSDLSSIFSECRNFSEVLHLVHFRWNPWEVWIFHRYSPNVRTFPEVHSEHIFHETFEKFGLSSMFSECCFFQRFTLSIHFRWNSSRSLIYHRYSLSMECFRGPYLVTSSMKPLRMFSLSSIFSECGIFQRFTLSTLHDETLEKFGLSSRFSKSRNSSKVYT